MYLFSILFMCATGAAAFALVLWGFALMVRQECETMQMKKGG